jgi:hypothetical protein
MNRNRGNSRNIFVLLIVLLFLLASCSSIPLFGKKKEEKVDKGSEGATVKVEGMEMAKGVNPAKPETPAKPGTPVPKKPSPASPPVPPKTERETKVASTPARPFYGSSLPFFQSGLRKKVAVLDFENKTTYKEENLGEVVAKRLSDKLEATNRVVTVDKAVLAEILDREGFKVDSLMAAPVMKRAHQSVGIQAFAYGVVTDVSLLSSKASESSDEEVTFATSKIEIRLVDASTANPLKSFIGRSPIFGTKEQGEYSRSKAIVKAIDLSLDEILDGFLRQIDQLEWTTTIARVEGENLYLNAGKLSGIRIGDTLEVFEPGKEILHPATNLSLGWTTGRAKGTVRITELFGVDASIGKAVQGQGFTSNDVVKSAMK